MATKQEILKDLKSFAGGGGVISPKQLTQYMGVCGRVVKRYMTGVPYIGDETGKRYMVIDVATRLAELQKSG